MIGFRYSDGGRSKYFKALNVGDCVARAISNATGKDYKEVYDSLNRLSKTARKSKREVGKSSARDGVHTRVAKMYIEGELGWVWHPCMGIGTGCKVHVSEDELPSNGSYILCLSGHYSCIKDGTLVDTYDCSRGGTRCVYGYWGKPTKAEAEAFAKARDAKEAQAKAREDAKAHNKAIAKRYAKRIAKLKAQLKRLERERDSKMLPTK